MSEDKKNVYLSLHKSFVREDIPYADANGNERTFNQVTLPKGTVIDGRDVGGYTFSPLFVNESKYRGADWRDVPLLADREVWLAREATDADGNRLLDQDGRPERETIKVTPQAIKEALTEARKAWAQQHGQGRSLRERADTARDGAQRMQRSERALADRDIPF
ncbi:MAG: DNA gyrase [Gordonibacter pamelaeae]|uniref:DNA gyrase n=1 Tax=Eggerthellaceae TaxID=1643826 RepID=UPI000DF83112|nr:MULTISPECIES: DNA gyrase [Eggerthellaceae]HJH74551.1 DNA gyrase [Eggerthellaceae bacterium]MBS4895191.1 DNA gyrase [Gordonibacter pamelaeae]MDU1907065.1 DNA gyrase [Eggerthella sp.]MDU5257809.1 DNA gyrase [Eggerthella sp.]RDC16702.1 DNA gyrase [Eggerthella lenta]